MLSEVLCCLLLIIIYFVDRRPSNVPPGKWGIPLFGSIPSKSVSLVEQVRELRKKYGDVFSWRIGGRVFVFLCNFKIIKTAMNKPELSYRPDMFTFDVFMNYHKQGVINTSGPLWVKNRRFLLRHMKDLGMGKTSYESVIQKEVVSLVECFSKNLGKAMSVPWSINVAVLNVVWRIAADRRYDVDDEDIIYFNRVVSRLFANVNRITALYDLMPWLPKYIPGFIHRRLGGDDYPNRCNELKTFVGKVIEEHKQTLNPENPRDIIDYYLIEMKEQKDDPLTNLTEKGLLRIVCDLFIAGTETTATTMRWVLFYIAKHQDMQTKVQEELDHVVGRNVLPSLEHRNRLPYLEAVLREVQRTITFAAFAVPHAASHDTEVNGYTIPKDAVVMISLDSCHIDPAYWEKPNEFYPEHFLDKEGSVNTKKEGFVPFSIGKRICPGESLAVIELFLFTSGLLQNFRFALAEGTDLNPKRNPADRLSNPPEDYKVIITERE